MSDLSKRVREVISDCMYRDEELPEDGSTPEAAVVVRGIMANFGFHPERLESHMAEIRGFCNEVGVDFQKSSGGGTSFLNLCMTRDGVQWGEHPDCEMLVALAIGTKQGGFCLPREMWGSLPGGMPYVWFDTKL